MQHDDLAEIEPVLSGFHIDHLTAHHAFATGGTGQFCDELASHFRGRVSFGRGQDGKSQRLQAIAGQYRRCFIERSMRRRSAAAQIIVVHAWQIVMYQRIGVQKLNGCRHSQGALGLDPE